MKTIRKLLLLAAFLFHILMIASASDREIKVIQINQKERLLSAPSAESYQWFYNGKKLSMTGREIKKMTAGTYTVEMTDVNGMQYSVFREP